MTATTVTVHDTAHAQTPIPFAVSRVVLHPWCTDYHPETVHTLHPAPLLANCMADALTRIEQEAPGFVHGMLVHGVQKSFGGPVEVPVVRTLLAYARRYSALGAIPLNRTARYYPQPPRHVVLFDTRGNNELPKWAWHMLAASLLHDVDVIGTPPEPLE